MAEAAGRRCPRLTLVTDEGRSRMPLLSLVTAALDGGVDAVQVRSPALAPADRAKLVESLVPVCRGRALLTVNNDAGLARAWSLGLHLPENADPLPRAEFAFLSRSVHTPAAAAQAIGYDAIVAGHVFASASKPGRSPRHASGLRAIVEAARAPVIAIGGIDDTNAATCILAGAAGVAVIGSISEAPDPACAAEHLRRAVDRAFQAGRTARDKEMLR